MLAPLHGSAPRRFGSAAPDPDLYRACALCDHGRPRGDRAHGCALLGAQPLPVQEARAPHGPCGRDAAHLRVGGWDLRA